VSDAAPRTRAGRAVGPPADEVPSPAESQVRDFLLGWRGRAVGDVTILPLSGDASTRRYFRIVEGVRSYVLALYPEPFTPEGHPFLEVRELLHGYGLPVPGIVGVDGAKGAVLQEDLGDSTLQEVLRGASEAQRAELYAEAVDAVSTLQRKAAEGGQSSGCFRIAFDIEKLSWELHYFQKHFLEGHRRRELTVEDRATLSEAFHLLCQEIASWPRVLCHRDYHSRNLMLHRGRLVWIDFQDARMGPATYDLASLLRDAYADVPEELGEELAERFRQRAVPGERRELFRRRFELTCVQRTLKALGTFGYMASVRGNPVYLPYIPRTLAHARRNLARHPELERLWRTLGRHVEELA
jgi:aminoglycoside/choline kinase family phosphotransferase